MLSVCLSVRPPVHTLTVMHTQFKFTIIQCYQKNNGIFCLILEILGKLKFFGNYFLTFSNENNDHLCFYFVFLNQPPTYDKID